MKHPGKPERNRKPCLKLYHDKPKAIIAACVAAERGTMTPDGKYIYAVDFDGTLSVGDTEEKKWPNIGDPNIDLIKYLIRQRIEGNKVILNTNRTDKLLVEAVRFCRAQGLEFDAINMNLPEIILAYGKDSRKISADFYIDDLSIHPEDVDWGYMNLHKRSLTKGERANERTESL